MELRWLQELERLGVSGLLAVAGFSGLGAVWRLLAKRDKVIQEQSTRIRYLSELVTRTQDLRIEDQQRHSRHLRETIAVLWRASHAEQPLTLDDVLLLDGKDFELKSSERK